MTSLRQRMIEDMQVRNLSPHTSIHLRPAGFAVCSVFRQTTGPTRAGGDSFLSGIPKGLPHNKVYHSWFRLATGKNGIVQLWVLAVEPDVQVLHLVVADFNPRLVAAFVQNCLYPQTSAGRGGADSG